MTKLVDGGLVEMIAYSTGVGFERTGRTQVGITEWEAWRWGYDMDACCVEMQLELATGGETWRKEIETGKQTPGRH